MTTELGFLVDFLLSYRLPKEAKEAVKERLKVVGEYMQSMYVSGNRPHLLGQVPQPVSSQNHSDREVPLHVSIQAPSMQAIMARNPDLVAPSHTAATPNASPPPVVAVQNIAQTPAAQAALASRQALISNSMAGKVDKERVSRTKS